MPWAWLSRTGGMWQELNPSIRVGRTRRRGCVGRAGAVRSTPLTASRKATEAIRCREFVTRDPEGSNQRSWCMPRWQAIEASTTRGRSGRVRAAGAFPACGAAPDGRHIRDATAGPAEAGHYVNIHAIYLVSGFEKVNSLNWVLPSGVLNTALFGFSRQSQ